MSIAIPISIPSPIPLLPSASAERGRSTCELRELGCDGLLASGVIRIHHGGTETRSRKVHGAASAWLRRARDSRMPSGRGPSTSSGQASCRHSLAGVGKEQEETEATLLCLPYNAREHSRPIRLRLHACVSIPRQPRRRTVPPGAGIGYRPIFRKCHIRRRGLRKNVQF